MKLLLVGDTHGEWRDVERACIEAYSRNISHVVILGDFGLWDHAADGVEFLDLCQRSAELNNVSIYAIGGNHENWDHWNWYIKNLPTHKGFAMVRRRVLLAPKAHKWTWNNKQFVAAGGAVSIDKQWRLAKEAGRLDEFGNRTGRAAGARTLWWPDEELSDQDVVAIQKWGVKADFLFTHDCSNYTPFQGRLKPDPDSERHRRRIDEVIRAVKPEMHFHGHMHTKYEWLNYQSCGYEHDVQTYGLECNSDWNSWGVLDTNNNSFAFRGVEAAPVI